MVRLKAIHFSIPFSFPSFLRRSTISMSSANSNQSHPLKYPQFTSLPLDPNRPQSQSPTTFRLVSYNILAQVYVKSSNFPLSPPACLKWKARSQALLSVLGNLGAHFLCLQEVDEFQTFYKPNLDALGYSALYVQRSGKKRDGCALFYAPETAELILQENIDYNDLVDSVADGAAPLESETENGRGDPNDPRVRLKRDCVGIVAAFKIKDCRNHVVIIANTHIYWDPEWVDVKLAQVEYLLSRLAKFKREVSERFDCTTSVIVAGDFNSTPGDKVCQYLGSEDVPIGLCSVYGVTKGEPEFTNCTPDFTNTLDYIFFSAEDSIKPVSLLDLPTSDEVDVLAGLPNLSHPSDHLPIGAEFEIFSST